MYKSITTKLLFTLAFCTIASILFAQNKQPLGLSNSNLPTISAISIPSFSYDRLRQIDEANNWQDRVSVPTDVSLGLNQGQWHTLKNGDRVWRIQLECKDAKGMALMLRDVLLPLGASLQMYAANGKHIVQAITSKDVNTQGNLLIGPAIGENIVLEYFEPKNVIDQGKFNLFRIQRLYKDYMPSINTGSDVRGFSDAWDCHVNLNCVTDDSFDDVERSVTRILMTMEEGMVYCSGALVNNTAQDMTPYILTAFHCASDLTPIYAFYRFDFNFNSPFCNDPAQEPPYNSLVGCSYVAGRADSDFELLRLFQTIPSSFNAYFAGWNRVQGYQPDTATLIHHPIGDIKKISQDYNQAMIFNGTIDWDNGLVTTSRSHYRNFMDLGAFQAGSSGSPLLDNNGHIIGQLHGGDALCDQAKAFCGRLTNSWTGDGTPETRLRDWLDPMNTGNLILDGFDPSNSTANVGSISGRVVSVNGGPLDKTLVFLSSDGNYPLSGSSIIASVSTDEDGFYTFNDVPLNQDYYVSASNNQCRLEGLSVSDLTRIQLHILFESRFSSPEQYIVSDINNDGVISTNDMLFLALMLLGNIDEFPDLDSYLIVRSDAVFENVPIEGQWEQDAMIYRVGSLSGPASVPDFIALKGGDSTLSSTGVCPD